MGRMYSLGDTLSRLKKKILEGIERIIVEMEEGEEIATIINNDTPKNVPFNPPNQSLSDFNAKVV